jgi:hypothetical protein
MSLSEGRFCSPRGILLACVFAIMSLVIAPGCKFDEPGGNPPSDDAGDDADVVDMDGSLDVVEDATEDAVEDAEDGADDAVEDVDPDADDASDTADATGAGYMEPCTEDADCASNYCLDTADGSVFSGVFGRHRVWNRVGVRRAQLRLRGRDLLPADQRRLCDRLHGGC